MAADLKLWLWLIFTEIDLIIYNRSIALLKIPTGEFGQCLPNFMWFWRILQRSCSKSKVSFQRQILDPPQFLIKALFYHWKTQLLTTSGMYMWLVFSTGAFRWTITIRFLCKSSSRDQTKQSDSYERQCLRWAWERFPINLSHVFF